MEPTADGGGTVGAGDPGTGRRPDQTDRGRAEPGGGGHSALGEGEPATGKAPTPHTLHSTPYTRHTLLPHLNTHLTLYMHKYIPMQILFSQKTYLNT